MVNTHRRRIDIGTTTTSEVTPAARFCGAEDKRNVKQMAVY
jgi:hypothetical protein